MNRMRLVVLVAMVASLMAMYLPPAAAQVGGGGVFFSFEGDTTLDPFPGSGSSTFVGTVANGRAVGITQSTHTPVAVATGTGTIGASFSYSETSCAFGTANGSISFEFSDGTTTVSGTADYGRIRAGGTAVFVLTNPHVDADGETFINTGGGAASAIFTVDDPVGACATTGSLSTHFTGAAAMTGIAV